MSTDRFQKIQQRAYEIWEREGRPEGRKDLHWDQASEEIEREEAEAQRSAADPSAFGATVLSRTPKG